MFNKLKEGLSAVGGGALESQIGTIQSLVKEHLGPKAAEIAKDDAKLTAAFKNIYTVLPAPVRLAVKEDKFVEFCFAHKDQVLAKVI